MLWCLVTRTLRFDDFMLKEYDVLSIWEDVWFLKRYVLLNWYDVSLTCNDVWLRERYCLMNDMMLCSINMMSCSSEKMVCCSAIMSCWKTCWFSLCSFGLLGHYRIRNGQAQMADPRIHINYIDGSTISLRIVKYRLKYP